MKQERFLIAGGNTTLLVEGCLDVDKIRVAQEAIEADKAEQVGFVSYGNTPRLDMMGGELSVNGTIAFASTLGKEGKLTTSGLAGEVNFENGRNGQTSIRFDLPYERDGDVVIFEGIGYLCTKGGRAMSEESVLWELAKKYKKPAFGLARYSTAEYLPRLEPIVYVDKIGSCVVETACGSGSIAVNIVTGAREIVQRTGEIISVSKYNGGFTVSAEVQRIKSKR